MEYFDFHGATLDMCIEEPGGDDRSPSPAAELGHCSEFEGRADAELGPESFRLTQTVTNCLETLQQQETPVFHVPELFCDHCRTRRMECLIVNGDIGCTSCKALSRVCSFVSGSRFQAALSAGQHHHASDSLEDGYRRGFWQDGGDSGYVNTNLRSGMLTKEAIAVFNHQYDATGSDDTPLVRWRNSPPDAEGVSTLDIDKALERLPHEGRAAPNQDLTPWALPKDKAARKQVASFSVYQAPSTIVSSSSNGSDRSAVSLPFTLELSSHSLQGLAELEKSNTLGRQRRRRRRAMSIGSVQHRHVDDRRHGKEHRKFQCTFCPSIFATKFDWQRHEESQHLSLESWICGRYGAIVDLRNPNHWYSEHRPRSGDLDMENVGGVQSTRIEIDSDNTVEVQERGNVESQVCPYCLFPCPPPSHFNIHHKLSLPCVALDVSWRTFYRKDHLVQHLHLAHNAKFQPQTMQTWRLKDMGKITSSCGFCHAQFRTWDERARHLAKEFRAGKLLEEDWSGGWGFEQWVEERLENVAENRGKWYSSDTCSRREQMSVVKGLL